jgi:hypothetical protein
LSYGAALEEESVEFGDVSQPGYELGSRGTEHSGVFRIGSCRILAREEADCAKKINM